MNILVLSPTKKLKNDKTEYSSKIFNALNDGSNKVQKAETFPIFTELELKKALRAADKPDLVIIPESIESEDDFRDKFAFIISHGERKVQDIPNTKEKIDIKRTIKDLKSNIKYIIGKIKKQDVRKEEREAKYVTYNRKKTHVFRIETGDFTCYAFNYADTKIAVIPKNADADSVKDLPKLIYKTFRENDEEYPDGYSLTEKTLKVTTFTERHFPRKSDPKNEKIRKTVMLAATLVFIVAGYMLIYNMFVMPAQQHALQSNIQTIFYENDNSSSGKTSNKFKAPNWKKLKKINKDIKGWIKLNNTQIDYPILQSKSDNRHTQFYLNHNYLKQYTPRGYGAIFIDYRSKQGMKSKNIVLHGHHMQDGSMFGDLMKYGRYSGNLGFYKKSPTIRICTPSDGIKTYKIFSVFKSNVNTAQGEYFDFYCSKFKSNAQFMNYIYNIRIRSLFDCPVNVNEDDKLLTLVTCSYEFNGFRTVVVARQCRENESKKVDVSAARLNKSPVWPQCYYSRFRGKRPTVLTFKKALKKGYLKWYDGSSNLSGSEQLPTSFTIPTVPPPTTATTNPTETEATTAKPTKPPKQYFTIKIIRRNKHGKKIAKTKRVKEGTTVTLPEVKPFIKRGYKYTFKKWRVKGFKGRNYLSRKYGKVIVYNDVALSARYKRKKIVVKRPVKIQIPTESPTEAQRADDSQE